MKEIIFKQIYDPYGNVYYMINNRCAFMCKDYEINEMEHNISDIMFKNIRDIFTETFGEDLIPEIEHDDTCD